jgi:hypothetical protein
MELIDPDRSAIEVSGYPGADSKAPVLEFGFDSKEAGMLVIHVDGDAPSLGG